MKRLTLTLLSTLLLLTSCGNAGSGMDSSGVSVPNQLEYVEYGSYQGEPITWLVLAEEDGKSLLLCKEYVCALPFDEKNDDCDWKDCSLRSWLNGTFYEKAFSDEERKSIVKSTLTNEPVKFAEDYNETILAAGDEPYFFYYGDENYDELKKATESEGGSVEIASTAKEESTDDNVFLLSLEETKYIAALQEAFSSENEDVISDEWDGKSWRSESGWLRTHAASSNGFFQEGSMIYCSDDFYPWGADTTETRAVRPAMWLER